ncbi:MAG: hypothetical protein ACYCWC_01940 [Rhodocyclaceae bacterium]
MSKTTLLKAMAVILMMGVGMNATAGWFGLGGTSWKEEVLLHDGGRIMVERWHKRGGRHEISSGPPVKEQSIALTLPGMTKTVTWQDEYSEEIGSANFVPLALHILNGTPYIVAEPYGCIAYNKWGRPNPPYVVFTHDGKSWQRIQLSELPQEFKTINLVIGTSNAEKKLDTLGTVPAAEIEKMNRDYTQPQYRSILREGLAEQALCPDWNSSRYTSPKAPNVPAKK